MTDTVRPQLLPESNMSGRLEGKRYCYYVPAIPNENGEFTVAIVIEKEAGYYLTDWEWGKDRKLAEEVCQQKNERLGISEDEALVIVLSSMYAPKETVDAKS
jgi:hypothetical protein